ncbi:peptidoglycan/LPS O-acetylase OafA/YrhL [Microbacterium marinum]|uniref:Peptidoglycan/LPS O-acetylase OafA/YrhL n=1 Tax=Microbacterium marinum TaxID=421115 RepID=A0A7W7BPC8_9MICO|nr:acyltransferase family protein [Microbacterium marinum]MBB4666345.1 peptidoglycan/LPS O-acetylase OafA/YrhL [Microbacterium marinum]
MSAGTKYLPHVDGIRAFAVLPVVLFHLGAQWIPGGFVGVDTFFVISGYLITGILWREMDPEPGDDRRFSIWVFYQRRALRILPALVVVLAVVLVMSAVLQTPAAQAALGAQVLAATLFVSNFYFWQTEDYFAADPSSLPLLHTWSLAVEEQFYLIFPLLLLVVARWMKRRVLVVLAAIIALSLIASVFVTSVAPGAAFYLLPTRAWELGAGALLAIWQMRRGGTSSNPWIALTGLALVVGSVFLIDKSMPFPGAVAIAPVLGAVLLIGWARATWVGRVLEFRPLLYVGTISYSLYLWHWPVIVFWRTMTGNTIDPVEMIGLFAVAFLLAAASTAFVERPFRTRRVRAFPPRRVLIPATAVILVCATAGGLWTRYHFNAIPVTQAAQKVAETAEYSEAESYREQFRRGICFFSGSEANAFATYDKDICATPEPNALNVLVLGDSHGAMWWRSLDLAYPDANVMQATASGCFGLQTGGGENECIELRDWVWGELIPSGEVDVVVLAGRWQPNSLPAVERSIETLTADGIRTVVMGPTVEYDGDLPVLLSRSVQFGTEFDFESLRIHQRDAVNAQARVVADAAGADAYIDVIDVLCGDSPECVLQTPEGVPMQFDYGHLTLPGTEWVIDQVDDQLDPYLAASPTARGDAF